MTTDDYTLVSPDGQISGKKEMVDNFKSGKTKFDKYECSDLKARMYGNAGVVTGTTVATGMAAGQKETDRKSRFTRTYVKQGGQWKAAAVQFTDISSR